MLMRGTRVRKKLEFFDWEGRVCGYVDLFQGGRLFVVQKPNKEVFCFQEGDKTITVVFDPAPAETEKV